jgi:hypothetical protein
MNPLSENVRQPCKSQMLKLIYPQDVAEDFGKCLFFRRKAAASANRHHALTADFCASHFAQTLIQNQYAYAISRISFEDSLALFTVQLISSSLRTEI